MSEGRARRAVFRDLAEFADEINTLSASEAIALGALRDDLPDVVDITTKDRLQKLNGATPPSLVARTSEFFTYREGETTVALIDIDMKGMPNHVRAALDEVGGFLPALTKVLPEMARAGRIERSSTSTGIYRTDTGTEFPGSGGLHIFVLVQNGADVERFLRSLHSRCWLHGFGWMMVGAGGQLLERSIVDRMVYAPERLVFEGAPVLIPPLAQNMALRVPRAIDGAPLDTESHCRSLTVVEQAVLKTLRAKEAHRLKPDADKARTAFIEHHSVKISQRTGIPVDRARRIIQQQTSGILLPDVALPFDDPSLAGCTAGDVLADPLRFAGMTLADPLEGTEYGECKAKVMLWSDGTPWIHSFAHGRTVYRLRYDAETATRLIKTAPDAGSADLFARIMTASDLTVSEAETLRAEVTKRSGIGKRDLNAEVKRRIRDHTQEVAREENERRTANRMDKRPQIRSPLPDAPWLPEMATLNEVLGASTAREPPMRDIDGVITQVRTRRVPDMHALTAEAANAETGDSDPMPAPEQPLLTRLSETQLAEMIECYIDYADATGRSVHLPGPFVRHYHTRLDDALPVVAAIATLPIVTGDGKLLSGRGLDRAHGIVFRVPDELRTILPAREQCTPSEVAEAIRFLVDDWLADVAADYTGKCTIIAAAMTIIERAILPDRPAFFVTAGRRGGGKTTTLGMMHTAVTGVRPAAAAWSTNEEERRKALLAYLMEGVPAIIWDNIVRGTQISCPHVEKSCTAAFYSDRRLGVSELISVAASSIHFFTGNNIDARGDLASRSLRIRLEIDRSDPENRKFLHPDPINWTEANRAKILTALYIIMLGNPAVQPGSNAAPQTRFKAWWRLVGSAVEHAARQHVEHVAALAVEPDPNCPAIGVNFRDLFLNQEDDDEESAGLGDALQAMAEIRWLRTNSTGPFQASDLARYLNDRSEMRMEADVERTSVLHEFLFPEGRQGHDVSAKSVGRTLKRHLGEPVRVGKSTLILRQEREPSAGPKGALTYKVQSS